MNAARPQGRHEMRIKITVNGMGGELDSVTVDARDEDDDTTISEAVRNLAADQLWHAGDSLTVEAVTS